MYDLGQRLRECRERANLTQSQAAKKLKVDNSTVSRYEDNTATPSLYVFADLCRVYKADPYYLLGLEHRESRYIDKLSTNQKILLDGMLHEFGQVD